MSDLPPPTPEGVLIRDAREMAIPKRSIPEVAHRVGIDPGTLGNIERGYRHLGEGRTRKVAGDPVTIAKIARELGISAEDLAARGKRPDAAERLRAMLARAPAGDRGASPEDEALRSIAGDERLPEDVRAALVALAKAMRDQPGGAARRA